MKSSLGISDFLEEIFSLSYSIVFLSFFALFTLLVSKSCPTLLQLHGWYLTSLHCPWDFQARILEWVAISFSKIAHFGRLSYLSLLLFGTLHSDGNIFLFLLCLPLLFFSQLFVRCLQTAIFPFCISFSWWWFWSPPVQGYKPPSIVPQALFIRPNLLHLFVISTV